MQCRACRWLRLFGVIGRPSAAARLDASHADLGWEELQDYDYVGLAYHSPNMEATHRFRLRRQATVSDQEAIVSLILSGCYAGFLPPTTTQLPSSATG